MKEKKICVTLQMTKKMKEYFVDVAKKNHRSLSAQIIFTLETEMNNRLQ